MDDACSTSLLSIGVKLSSRKATLEQLSSKKGNEHLLHVFCCGVVGGLDKRLITTPETGELDPKSR